jgi:hypothetical protein
MPRLLLHVEGQTEETFVNEVLADHLRALGYSMVSARLVGNPRVKRGGIRPWSGIKRDIVRHLRHDPAAIVALMVDYYGLPGDWPGRTDAPEQNSTAKKAMHVEQRLIADVIAEFSASFDQRRFVPLVMMHEFEALLFSDPDKFAQAIGKSHLAGELGSIRDKFDSPEDIDDSPATAPSKRIEALFPGYEKPLSGTIAALDIGLAKMREQCPHFNQWLTRLEVLSSECSYLG